MQGMRTVSRAGSYRELLVWRKGIDLVKLVYQVTRSLPPEERFGLTAQMRRAVISIPANIAEGQARRTAREFVQFISYAEGSAAELDTQLVVARELGYFEESACLSIGALLDEVRRMLNGLRRALIARDRTGRHNP